MFSPHISPFAVERTLQRRCGTPHNPMCQRHIGGEVRACPGPWPGAGCVYTTFSGRREYGLSQSALQRRNAAPPQYDCMDAVGGTPLVRQAGGPTLRAIAEEIGELCGLAAKWKRRQFAAVFDRFPRHDQPLPRHGMVRLMTQRITRSKSRPSSPSMMIVIQMIS